MLSTARLKKELLLAAALLGVGLVVVPLSVYWVGQQVVGDYESDAGIVGLVGQIWADFVGLRLGAWLLVFGPYLVVALLRFALWVKRYGRGVTEVTDSKESA